MLCDLVVVRFALLWGWCGDAVGAQGMMNKVGFGSVTEVTAPLLSS